MDEAKHRRAHNAGKRLFEHQERRIDRLQADVRDAVDRVQALTDLLERVGRKTQQKQLELDDESMEGESEADGKEAPDKQKPPRE